LFWRQICSIEASAKLIFCETDIFNRIKSRPKLPPSIKNFWKLKIVRKRTLLRKTPIFCIQSIKCLLKRKGDKLFIYKVAVIKSFNRNTVNSNMICRYNIIFHKNKIENEVSEFDLYVTHLCWCVGILTDEFKIKFESILKSWIKISFSFLVVYNFKHLEENKIKKEKRRKRIIKRKYFKFEQIFYYYYWLILIWSY
jgi:hypothetical protein